MTVPDRAAELLQALRERFALEQFRPGQREVIENVLDGRDVLCVMPTGGGKSLCYQLPSLLLPGLTLVVSPLIALMKDQVDALHQRGVRATLLNSTLDASEQHARILEIEAGRFDLVYVAPERFRSARFLQAMARIQPTLLAVDEAHCISEWGHDFRPDYARIGQARKKLGMPTCIALTATATDLVRRDIAEQLSLRDPAQFVTGFDRPNLTYAVTEARRDAEKLAALARVLEGTRGAAIVYASSRARCESVAEFLRHELRRDAVVYHAGMTRDERTSAQERFMSGRAEIVVATNAFGMGVDKSDIRAVVHYNLPGTLEAYYQEAGRAGRDGAPARCELLYAPGDRMLQELFIENAYPPPPMVYQVYNYLRKLPDDPIEKTQAEIKDEAGVDLGDSAVGTALKLLEVAGVIERFLPRENMAIVRINAPADLEPEDRAAATASSLVDRLGPQAHVQRLVLLGLEGLVNGRLSEPVYFHPDDLAGSLGLDRAALGRALRALCSELPIDYVPPFRGNAIRVLDRKRNPRDLGIDFPALQVRRQREYDKLEQMIKYAQATRCRRAYLLGYFGDRSADGLHCGRCDNCGEHGDAPDPNAVATVATPIATPGGREVVLKVLSGVARAKGRFGKNLVAQMLKGSGAEKMERTGLKNLSTFGILPDFTQPELTQVLDALAEAGLVEYPEVDRFRPIVRLTEIGWAYLKRPLDHPVELSLSGDLAAKLRAGGLARLGPKPTSGRAEHPEPLAVPEEPEPAPEGGLGDDPLFESLRALRLELAREANQPAYCIFTNQTLEALVRDRPSTPAALAAIKGFGASRLERFGSAVLQKIAATPTGRHAEPPRSTPAPAPVASPAASNSMSSRLVPTEEWTWKLLERGFSPDDAAAIRGLPPAAILRHAALAARQGKPVRLESFLSSQRIQDWERWRSDNGDDSAPPEDAGAADLWSLFIAVRRRSNDSIV